MERVLRGGISFPKEEPIRAYVQQSALAFFGRDVTELARRGKLEPVIGRKGEILRVARILSQKRKANPVLVGEPGVGRDDVAAAVAERCKIPVAQLAGNERERLVRIEATLPLDDSVYALLMREGYSPESGARPMERAVEALIAPPLAKAILEGRAGQRGELIARAAGRQVTFEVP